MGFTGRQRRIRVEKTELKAEDVVADAAQRRQKTGIGGAMGLGQLLLADADRVGLQPDLIEFLGVIENGFEAALAHIGADSFDSARGIALPRTPPRSAFYRAGTRRRLASLAACARRSIARQRLGHRRGCGVS